MPKTDEPKRLGVALALIVIMWAGPFGLKGTLGGGVVSVGPLLLLGFWFSSKRKRRFACRIQRG